MIGLATQLRAHGRVNKENIMEIKLSANAQLGFDYIASKEGKTVEAIVSESIERQGLAFFEDKKRGEIQDLIAKVQKYPTACKASIEAIAAVEAQKEAAAMKEAEELKEV
jgi:hypothetical protein